MGEPVRLPKKAQALIAFLAMRRGQPVAREQLATLLWELSADEQARQSLRQCLASLRSVAEGETIPLVAGGSDKLVWPAADGNWIDVEAFDLLARSDRVEDLRTAATLVRDEFLAGMHVHGQGFSDWLMLERQAFASRHIQLLERCAEAEAAAGDLSAAIEVAQRLAQLDPLREESHRLLMRLLAASGDRVAALRQFQRCADILKDELGLKPGSATSALASSIRDEEGTSASDTEAGASLPGPLADGANVPDGVSSPHEHRRSDKPSILVLPFANLSGDAGHTYLAEGFTEDITIALGRERWLFVVASASAMALQDQRKDPVLAGAALDVRYVLRGSVRVDGGRIRVVVQLADAAFGSQIWSARLEDSLDNLFSMQDRLTNQIVAQIAPALRTAEAERVRLKPPGSLTAYELYLKALPRCRRSLADNEAAVQLLQQATELDPAYGAAYGLAARCFHFRRMLGWAYPDDPALLEGIRMARLAIANGGGDSEALWMAGLAIAMIAGDLTEGLHWIDKSLSINPSSANAWIASCFTRTYLGQTEAALAHFENAQRLNPVDSTQHLQWHAAATAHFVAGRYEESDAASDRTLQDIPDYPGALRIKIATCGLLGRDAGRFIERLERVNPGADVAMMRAYWKDILAGQPSVAEAFIEGCRRAGLP